MFYAKSTIAFISGRRQRQTDRQADRQTHRQRERMRQTGRQANREDKIILLLVLRPVTIGVNIQAVEFSWFQ